MNPLSMQLYQPNAPVMPSYYAEPTGSTPFAPQTYINRLNPANNVQINRIGQTPEQLYKTNAQAKDEQDKQRKNKWGALALALSAVPLLGIGPF